MRGRQKGEHEHVAVPEDVAAVGPSAEAARPDGRLVRVSDRRHQVEEREANRPLELRVSLDDHVGFPPALRPCFPVLAQEPFEARALRRGEPCLCNSLLWVVGAEALEDVAVPPIPKRSCDRLVSAAPTGRHHHSGVRLRAKRHGGGPRKRRETQRREPPLLP